MSKVTGDSHFGVGLGVLDQAIEKSQTGKMRELMNRTENTVN